MTNIYSLSLCNYLVIRTCTSEAGITFSFGNGLRYYLTPFCIVFLPSSSIAERDKAVDPSCNKIQDPFNYKFKTRLDTLNQGRFKFFRLLSFLSLLTNR